jgi:RimJ/RimL family protein N-acetyltransferase
MEHELDQLLEWRNDPRLREWFRQIGTISKNHHVRWYLKQKKDPSIEMKAIEVDKALVGVCGLTSICDDNERAEFSLYIAPKFWGNGWGEKALKMLLDYGFSDEMGLNVIWGETFDGNPAYKIFERIGMVKEGTRRYFYKRDDEYIHAHLYSITRGEHLDH